MLTFAALSELFLNDYAKLVQAGCRSQQTCDWYRMGLDHLIRKLGDRPADDIRAYEITAVKFTPHVVRSARMLFRWATRNRLLQVSPLLDVPMPKYKDRSRVLTDEEFRKVRRNIAKSYRWLLWFMRRTCARPGELRNAKWSDVLWDESVLLLEKFKGKDFRRDKSKVRYIYFDPTTMRVLQWIYRSRFQGKPVDSSTPIFPNAKGLPIKCGDLVREFGRTAKRLKLNMLHREKAVAYTIRHTAATAAANNGCQLQDLAEIMGHSSIQMTKRYVHPSREHLRKAAATINARGQLKIYRSAC